MTVEEIVKDYEYRAQCERDAGGSVEINRRLPYVAVTMSEGSKYFFRGDEADALIDEADNTLDGAFAAEDYILATAQSWG